MLDFAELKSSDTPLAVEWPAPLRQFDCYFPGSPLKIVNNLLVCDFGILNLKTGVRTKMPGISYEDARFGFLLGDNSIVHYCPGMSEQFSVDGFYVGTLDKAERKLLNSAKFNNHISLLEAHGDHVFVYATSNLEGTGWDVYSANAREDKTSLLLKDCPNASSRHFFSNAMAYAGIIKDQGKSKLVTKRRAGNEIISLAFEEHSYGYQWNDSMLVVSKDHSTVQIFDVGSVSTKSLGIWSSENSSVIFPWLTTFQAFNATLLFGASNDGYPVLIRFSAGELESYRLRVPKPIFGEFQHSLVSPETICLIGNKLNIGMAESRVLVYETQAVLKQIELSIERAGHSQV